MWHQLPERWLVQHTAQTLQRLVLEPTLGCNDDRKRPLPSRIMARRPIATQGLLGVAATSESPCTSGVVVSAARERARCELPAVVPLVMSAAMSQLSCNVAHSPQHSSMLASRQLVHVGSLLVGRDLQLLKPRGRTWHNCKLSDLSNT